MATHSSILAWEIPWTEQPSGIQSMELQRVGYDLATKQQQYAKQVTDETILDSTRNPTQCSVVAQMGMKSKKGDIYIYMAEKETQKGKTAV